MTPEEGRAVALQWRAQGLSVRQVANRLGVHFTTVADWASVGEVKRERARQLRADGWDYASIANEVGVSRTTAFRWANPEAQYRSSTPREVRRASDARRKAGCRCVSCNALTGAVDEAGDSRCLRCQRAARELASHAALDCPACGNPMLEPAPMCGLCALELQETVRGDDGRMACGA